MNIPHRILFNRFSNRRFSILPLYNLTPFDVYLGAKKSKIHTLRQKALRYSENSSFQLELAKKYTLFWNRTSNNQKEKGVVNNIVNEIEKRTLAHEEHSDIYLATLIKTINLIIQTPSQTDCSDYVSSAEQFKKRSHVNNSIDDIFFYNQICILMLLIAAVIKLLKLPENYTYGLCTVSLTSAAVSYFNFTRVLNRSIHRKHTILPTPLSEAMCELSELRNPGISLTK